MILNKPRRIVLLSATILIAATGIYPPWIGTENVRERRGDEISPVGEYGLIFSPPTLPGFLVKIESIKNMADPKLGPHLDRSNWSWRIEISRLMVEWATVATVAAGLYLILQDT